VGAGHKRVEVEVEVDWRAYADRVGDRPAFLSAFQRFCGHHNLAPCTPTIAGFEFQAYPVFRAVAERGGALAVTQVGGEGGGWQAGRAAVAGRGGAQAVTQVWGGGGGLWGKAGGLWAQLHCVWCEWGY
jgi:hypothetical protein